MIEPELGSAAEDSAIDSLGVVLKSAREAKQLTIEEVSLRINIPAKHLVSLENQAYDKLPGLPFAKGYLRSYAKALGLNAEGLVAQLVDEAAATKEPSVTTINKVGQQVNVGHPLMKISLVIFIIALAGVSFWWWQAQSTMSISGLSSDNSEEQSIDATPSAGAVENAEIDPTDIQARLAAKREEMASLEQAFSELNASSADEKIAENNVVNPDADESEPVYLSEAEIAELANQIDTPDSVAEDESGIASAIGSQNATENEAAVASTVTGILEIEFSGDCWVSIRDASDKLVFANTKRAGETLSLNLDLPASVLVGKVSAVSRAQFNGEVLDLAAEAKKDVAKITLSVN